MTPDAPVARDRLITVVETTAKAASTLIPSRNTSRSVGVAAEIASRLTSVTLREAVL